MLRHALALSASLVMLGGAGCGGTADESPRPAGPSAQPGDMTLDYITGETYPSLLVEVDYIRGHAPASEALAKMREIFASRIEKPGGIEFLIDSEIPPERRRDRYEVGDIVTLESQYRRNHTGDAANRNQAVIWMVYLNGASEFDEGGMRALGISYDASSVAIFQQNLEETTVPEVRETVEAMVLVHEGGHLFGLVNNGLPMVNAHEDALHARHDAHSDCIMFHRIETGDVERLASRPPIDFDYQCRLDMYNAGGPHPGPRPPGAEPPPAPLPPRGPRPPRGPILCVTFGK